MKVTMCTHFHSWLIISTSKVLLILPGLISIPYLLLGSYLHLSLASLLHSFRDVYRDGWGNIHYNDCSNFDYKGNESKTDDGVPCRRWDEVNTSDNRYDGKQSDYNPIM